MSTIFSESVSSNPSALIELFELDLSPQGGQTLRFHAGSKDVNDEIAYQTNTSIIWGGKEYRKFPVVASGFARTTDGSLPRPVMSVADPNGEIGAMCRQMNDLRNCRITRIRTHAKFLDAINFDNGNPSADSNQHYPLEIWYVSRKAEHVAGKYIKFELAAPFDVTGVTLPRRQMLRVCPAQVIYRGGDCGYLGTAKFDEYGNPVTTANKDKCGKRYSDCKLRNNQKRFGGFVTIGLMRT